MTDYVHVVVDLTADDGRNADRRAFDEDLPDAARDYADKKATRTLIMDVPVYGDEYANPEVSD